MQNTKQEKNWNQQAGWYLLDLSTKDYLVFNLIQHKAKWILIFLLFLSL